ncbi:hypothetical protein LTR56_008392 [Elasticomyces elasticus]|nr:hypothetical protein LTR56_008392 [Elasticomyces elasticus]KAK4913796.1 hypothetical protein LTR49_017944 [Elasticomyces elasticus]KAK5758007.1 hypothetical protein LTS12_011902 [Elasticomyces elasticus]
MPEEVSALRSEHADLIQGVSRLYSTLIGMSYLQHEDVHFAQPGVDVSQAAKDHLRTAGFGEYAIMLCQLLPALTTQLLEKWSWSEDGIRFAPGRQAVSYLVNSVPDVQDMRFIRNGEAEITHNDFKLARCGASVGEDRVYRFAEKSLEVLPLSCDDSDEPQSHQQPIADALRDWRSKFHDLEWIPWSDDNGMYIEKRPMEWENDQADPWSARLMLQLQHTAWQQANLPMAQISVEQLLEQHAERIKAERNKFWAKRRIYQDAGWPEAFDAAEFRRKRDEWNQQYSDVTDLYRYGPQAARYWEPQHGQGLRDIFKTTAGRYAV